jgi:hypothetical protein
VESSSISVAVRILVLMKHVVLTTLALCRMYFSTFIFPLVT